MEVNVFTMSKSFHKQRIKKIEKLINSSTSGVSSIYVGVVLLKGNYDLNLLETAFSFRQLFPLSSSFLTLSRYLIFVLSYLPFLKAWKRSSNTLRSSIKKKPSQNKILQHRG